MNIKHKVVILIVIIWLLVTAPAFTALLAKGLDWSEILRIMSAYLVALVGVSVGFSLNAERIVCWLSDDGH